MRAEAIENRKLARWRATRDGALYACPHCWAGTREAGRCKHCRRFDVRAIARQRHGDNAGPLLRPSLPMLATQVEEALREARRPKRKRRRGRAAW